MTGSTLIISHFLQIFKKTIWNQVLQLYQNNVNLFFENRLNFMNVPINSHAQLKNLNKKKSFTKNHGLQDFPKFQFIRKTDSLKIVLNVTTK